MISSASAATLNVPSDYKTIQKAINAASSGDKIIVQSGIYNENLLIEDKTIYLQGKKFPTIKGIKFRNGGRGSIFGFKIVKTGIDLHDAGEITVRNCNLINCGIYVTGFTSSLNSILNNKITNGTIELYETLDNVVVGNYISNSKVGLCMREYASCKTISSNTFKNCGVAVQVDSKPKSLSGNKFIKNKKNLQILEV